MHRTRSLGRAEPCYVLPFRGWCLDPGVCFNVCVCVFSYKYEAIYKCGWHSLPMGVIYGMVAILTARFTRAAARQPPVHFHGYAVNYPAVSTNTSRDHISLRLLLHIQHSLAHLPHRRIQLCIVKLARCVSFVFCLSCLSHLCCCCSLVKTSPVVVSNL